MKKIISKILIFLFLFHIVIPLRISAADNVTIYNCENAVVLDYGIEQYYGKEYINKKDLQNINLYEESNSVKSFDGDVSLKLYPGSSIVVVNGMTIAYPNATVETKEGLYICVELLAMFFSKEYEADDTTIRLWISASRYDFAKGIISLPQGRTAPEGGIEIEVFVAEDIRSTSFNEPEIPEYDYKYARIGQVGYKKNEKPMYDFVTETEDAFLKYRRKASKTVIIPEGKNSVEYKLSIQEDDFYSCIVGYYTEFDGMCYFGKLNYKLSDTLYNFELSRSKVAISGNVSIPEIAESDVKFRVIAHGKIDFIYDGVIQKGKATADYLVPVNKNMRYFVELIFIEGEYLRTTLDTAVEITDIAVGGIDFIAEKADEYIVNVSLPDGYAMNTDKLEAELYLEMAESPYYLLDVKQVTLDKYSTSINVSLYDDMKSNKVICYYVLAEEYDGLFKFGHYTENGTSFDVKKADTIAICDNQINMPLLRAKEINATFNLPGEDRAKEDICIDAYPITVTYPGYEDEKVDKSISCGEEEGCVELMSTVSDGALAVGASSEAKLVTNAGKAIIKKGENCGNLTISIPDEDGYGYLLEFNVSGGGGKYYRKVYHCGNKASVQMEKATQVTNRSGGVNVELIRQFCISGFVNAICYNDSYNRIIAMAQNNDTTMNDIYNVDFSVYTDIYGNGNYALYVPEEFGRYILCLKNFDSGKKIYYKENECVDELSEAEILTVAKDMSKVDFLYQRDDNEIPMALMFDLISLNNDEWNIYLGNKSDFNVEDVTVYVGFYNSKGELTHLASKYIGIVKAETKLYSEMTVCDEFIQSASEVKVFVWSGLKPAANVFFVKN